MYKVKASAGRLVGVLNTEDKSVPCNTPSDLTPVAGHAADELPPHSWSVTYDGRLGCGGQPAYASGARAAHAARRYLDDAPVYVDRDAESIADTLWEAVGNKSGNMTAPTPSQR
jgi:hypothetical protein